MVSLNGAAPLPTSCQSTHADITKLAATPRMVTTCAPARPILRPNRPAMISPSSGASTMASSRDFEITMLLSSMSTPCIGSALHRIDFGDVDRAPVTEQRDEDRQADRDFGRGHGQDEEHEHLAGRIAELSRERHEIDVDQIGRASCRERVCQYV